MQNLVERLLLNRFLTYGIIACLCIAFGFMTYANLRLKGEVLALKNELNKSQEIILEYASKRLEFMQNKQNAMGILKDDTKDAISKFNAINSTLF